MPARVDRDEMGGAGPRLGRRRGAPLGRRAGVPAVTCGIARSGEISSERDGEIGGVDQPGDRHAHEIGIAEIGVAIGISEPHRSRRSDARRPDCRGPSARRSKRSSCFRIANTVVAPEEGGPMPQIR